MSKSGMQDNVDKEPGPSDSNQEGAKHRLNQSLFLIADGINILAAKAQKPEAEKSWDKAERDRKRVHDDRTFSRQGWAITVAGIAVAFNFIALVGLGVQSWNARNAVLIAEQTLAMNSRPSIAFSHLNVTKTDESVNMSFTTENKSTGTVYLYNNPIIFSDTDEETSYKGVIKDPKTSPAIAQIFPMSEDTSKKVLPVIKPFGMDVKGKKIYITFSVLASSFGQDRYIISECIIFNWDGSKFVSDGKLCNYNQRYERLEDYLSEKKDAF
ncbi:hypothetical protein GFGA_1c1232 [Gluconobacter frateurii NBRC 103465]|nr:hypothetical protein GFGA_1c1232 [Gluconobacter frateurii NBRC 103465]